MLSVDWAAVALELTSAPLPGDFSLTQNYPNPFNSVTTIRYELARETEMTLAIFDLLGREVARLVESRQQPGQHQAIWTGTTAEGRELPSGIYIARLLVPPKAGATPGYTESIKMLLLK